MLMRGERRDTHPCTGVRPYALGLLVLMSRGFIFCERITECRGVGPGPDGTGYGALRAGPDIDIRPLWCFGFFAVEGMGSPDRPYPSTDVCKVDIRLL